MPLLGHDDSINNAFKEPITEILGGPNIFLEEGNNLNLTCVVRDSPEPPQYIFWYRNSQVKTQYDKQNCIVKSVKSG